MTYSRVSEAWRTATDAEVLQASKGNPDLFEILLERYEDAFLRKANSILYSKEDAEEIVQDTFTRIYVYADKFIPQEGATFSSWAYSILIRLCFTRYAKVKKQRGRMQEFEPEHFERIPDQENFIEDLTLKNEVLVALSRLPEHASRVLRLQFLEGKTQEEIAEIEDSSVPAIKTRVHRAKKLLRETYPYDIQ